MSEFLPSIQNHTSSTVTRKAIEAKDASDLTSGNFQNVNITGKTLLNKRAASETIEEAAGPHAARAIP